MLDGMRNLRERLSEIEWSTEETDSTLPYLRAATAQLLVATGAGASLEHAAARPAAPDTIHSKSRKLPAALVWAPALVGSLAAAAHLEHAREPTEESARAVLLMNVASLATGGALFALDVIAGQNRGLRLGPLAFASAAVLGITLDRQERATREAEEALRRRAAIVERLVPKRKPKLDRLVVHV